MNAWLMAAAIGVGAALPAAPQPTPPVAAGAAQNAPATAPAAPGDPRLTIGGELSTVVDAVPAQDAVELRPELVLEAAFRAGERWRARADVAAGALLAGREGRSTDAVIDVREAWIEIAGARADLRAGIGRLAWGKLDEVQPSDVINPIDSARFFFTGRTDARLAVGFARGRIFVSDRIQLEGVLVPVFRRGRFDRLDEPRSPFNLVRDAALPAGLALARATVEHVTPPVAWRHVSGGGRASISTGRVDWSVSAWRGFDAFGPIAFEPLVSAPATAAVPGAGPAPAVVGRLVARHPRFTMLAGDLETVTGDWAWRGEVAWFVDRQVSSTLAPAGAPGQVLEAGAGFDRAVSGVRLFASVLLHREWSDTPGLVDTTDVNLVGSIERTFARDRYRARAFAVINPADRFAFVRGLLTWSLRDDLGAEFSAGGFLGSGDDAIARFDGRDFVLARLKYDF